MIVLAFVLCWLPFHVGRTIFSLSLGSGADRQEANMDSNSHFDMLTVANKDISFHVDSEAVSHPDSVESLPQPGKLTTTHLAETYERLCDMCPKTKVEINAHNHTLATDKSPFSTQTESDRGNVDTSMQNPHPGIRTNVLLGRPNNSLIDSQRHPTDLYVHDAHKDLNNTYSQPDAHVYFFYYLSQYFNLVSSILFYLSAAVNPLLYNLMSGRYRLAVCSLVQQHPGTRPHRLRTVTTRQSTTTL